MTGNQTPPPANDASETLLEKATQILAEKYVEGKEKEKEKDNEKYTQENRENQKGQEEAGKGEEGEMSNGSGF